MRTTLFTLLFLLNCLPMVGQGIVRPFEDLEDYRVVTSPYRSSVDVMETDAEGNVWIAGEFERVLNVMRLNDIRYTLTASSGNYLYLMKLDPNLEVLWAKRIRYNGWEGLAARRIRFDKDGNAILQGIYDNYLRFDDGEIMGDPRGKDGQAIYFAKITPEGEWIDKWEIRAPWISYCGDFRQLEDGTWRIAVLQAELPLYLPQDTIQDYDSPAKPKEWQTIDLVLNDQKQLKHSALIHNGVDMYISSYAHAYVTPRGSIWYRLFISDTRPQNNIEGTFWAGGHLFKGEGRQLIKFNEAGNLDLLSSSSQIGDVNILNCFTGDDENLFFGGAEKTSYFSQIDVINKWGRVECQHKVSGTPFDFVSDLELVSSGEVWMTGWYEGELSGDSWSVGYDVDWGYQPKQGFLVSFDLVKKQLKWVRTQPLLGDKNEIQNLAFSKQYYFLHTTWGSDTINFDTLGLNDIFFAPKELICKFRMPEVGNYSSEVSPIHAWPNPADEGIWIDLGEISNEGEKWELLSPEGRVVQRGISKNNQFIHIPLSSISNGIYFIRTPDSENKKTKKIIIQH